RPSTTVTAGTFERPPPRALRVYQASQSRSTPVRHHKSAWKRPMQARSAFRGGKMAGDTNLWECCNLDTLADGFGHERRFCDVCGRAANPQTAALKAAIAKVPSRANNGTFSHMDATHSRSDDRVPIHRSAPQGQISPWWFIGNCGSLSPDKDDS